MYLRASRCCCTVTAQDLLDELLNPTISPCSLVGAFTLSLSRISWGTPASPSPSTPTATCCPVWEIRPRGRWRRPSTKKTTRGGRHRRVALVRVKLVSEAPGPKTGGFYFTTIGRHFTDLKRWAMLGSNHRSLPCEGLPE